MGDLKQPNVASVISSSHDLAICTTSAEKKDQIFRQATTGTSYQLGQQIVFYSEIEQSNRMIDDIAFRYNVQNNHATANIFLYNGWWPFIDRLEVRVNGSIVGDFPLGSPNLMQLTKFNNYETFSRFVSDRSGTFIQTAGVDTNDVTPSNFRLAVTNGQSQRFESYLSEIIKCMYKIHVTYIRNFQIIVYLKSGTNLHKIVGHEAGVTAANLSLQNVEMILHFTNYKQGALPVTISPKLTFHEEFLEDRIYDVSGFAGQTTTVDIRLDTNYRAFLNIRKLFLYTDNTAVNATHTIADSFNVYNSTDVTQVEILHNGIRYAIFDNQRSLHVHQNKYHKRRSRRRTHSWLTFPSQLNQIPNSFIDTDRNDIVINNDGHYKTSMLIGWTNQVSVGGEWRLRVTGNWLAIRPNLHVCLEVSHLVNLFSDPNKQNFFQQ